MPRRGTSGCCAGCVSSLSTLGKIAAEDSIALLQRPVTTLAGPRAGVQLDLAQRIAIEVEEYPVQGFGVIARLMLDHEGHRHRTGASLDQLRLGDDRSGGELRTARAPQQRVSGGLAYTRIERSMSA